MALITSASLADEPGVVAAGAYAEGRKVADVRVEEAGEWASRPGHLVWIGLYEPSAALLREIQAQFRLHPLAIEDALNAHQRPKLERYGDCLFVVTRTAQLVQGRIALGETHLFVGRGYVVTVRHGASESYAPVREKTESCPKLLAHGEDYILYAVLDFIVDNYAPVMETVLAEAESLEDRILRRELLPAEIERLYLLRRDLLRLRTAVVPLVEVCRKLEHGDLVAIDEEMQPLFRDVSDHLRRVQDEIDALREVLAFAFEASLMLGQAQQTVITRRLAAWAAILAVPTAIAGIYGMNFENMPELKWRYGYFMVLAGIAALCGVLYWRFRKNDWL
ncbi:MAG: magnesium and cobalt transport protein CorA [Methylobacterium sp.]|uniref:magnesium and cobalt transport protein CorA n=1 Tax=Methylobacterium sp. TaxID=409 RepID=UPI002585AD4E|nr:magnesium and cobalt transport protein CorA [Methylobacterium sp.]MBY0296744.1 magnesium and cobalt transport protein CorA [Methylobacterium sp.]